MHFPWKECGLGQLRTTDATVLQSVYDRASARLPNYPEAQCELAQIIFRMYARGLHNEDALYDLCIIALRRRPGEFGAPTLYDAALTRGRALLKRWAIG